MKYVRNKLILTGIFKELGQKYPCCHLAGIPIRHLPKREQHFFRKFMSDAKSAIVVGHHVVTESEWTWYQTPEGSERCDADNHALEVCKEIKNELERHRFQCNIVHYPGISGLQFRSVAQAACLGQIGKNAFLLHLKWGPWIHLRVLATAAQTAWNPSLTQKPRNVCRNCSKCVENCPAKAFEHGFNGLLCRKFRESKGEYTPIGREQVYKWCITCALICPLGEKHA
jgi:epoxyqueuosine reductase QueG